MMTILASLIWVGCGSESFIPKLTISNPTRYDARVDVAGKARGGWTSLITVPAGSKAVAQEVFDEGSNWVFRFAYVNHQQEVQVSRTQLARDGWQVTVPSSFGAELESRGVSPPPS